MSKIIDFNRVKKPDLEKRVIEMYGVDIREKQKLSSLVFGDEEIIQKVRMCENPFDKGTKCLEFRLSHLSVFRFPLGPDLDSSETLESLLKYGSMGHYLCEESISPYNIIKFGYLKYKYGGLNNNKGMLEPIQVYITLALYLENNTFQSLNDGEYLFTISHGKDIHVKIIGEGGVVDRTLRFYNLYDKEDFIDIETTTIIDEDDVSEAVRIANEVNGHFNIW